MRGFSSSFVSWAKGAPVIHPFLFAMVPVLSLWSGNISEMSLMGTNVQVLLPLAVILVFAGSFWGLLSLILSNKKKAGLIVVLFLLLFFSYGHVHESMLLTATEPGPFYIQQRYLLLIWLSIFLGVGFLLLRINSSLETVTRFLNVIAIALIIVPLAGIGVFQITPRPSLGVYENETGRAGANPPADSGIRPDIYYVIVDGYASAQVLEENIDFDNSEFLDYLRGKGFYVADQSRSNYPFTTASIASSLNMKYLTFLADLAGHDRNDSDLYFQLIRESQVMKFLRSRGYKIMHTREFWMPRNAEALGDTYFGCEEYGPIRKLTEGGSFVDGLVRTTMFNAFRIYLPVTRHEGRRKVLCELASFDEINKIDGPKFSYIHLEGPHPPFLFGPQGEPIYTESTSFSWLPKSQYLDQMTYYNGRIEQIFDILLSTNDPPPVIILQADHGPFFYGYEHTTQVARTATGILNAYFLPDGDNGLLYDSITPVNTFRLIFNRYFGTDLEFLPDRTYFNRSGSAEFAGYSFIDVTDEVN